MSQTGNYTPLQLTALSALANFSGFAVNASATRQQGTWLPTGYTPGSVVNNTVLSKLTASLPNFLALATASTISFSTYRKLLTIGSDTVPALGNSIPATFKPSYAGYGSWMSGMMQAPQYPPMKYPTSGQFSYIFQAHGDYAYLTGWPGTNTWQQTTDTYKAAFVPTSADTTVTDYDTYFQNGFIGTIAQQAYNELWFVALSQYHDICNSYSKAASYRAQNNQQISSLANSKSYMPATFSNMNDLTTNNVSGVTQSFSLWGNDLINCGRTIDLSNIHRFGTPSVLLLTLQANGALTQAVTLALQYAGLTTTDLTQILNPTYTPTVNQEKKIYEAFQLIGGADLYSTNNGITLQLNCKLNNLRTLADLLDPQYLFPNSYQSLTVPQYRTDTPTSKVYYLIYNSSGVNPQVTSLGGQLQQTLSSIIPESLATACSAFSVSMQQIKNIMQTDIQKFAVSVVNLELTTKGLPLVNNTTGTAVNMDLVDQQLAQVALGSGNSGTYRQCDFFGAVSNYPYDDWLATIESGLNGLNTTALAGTYASLLALSKAGASDSAVLTLINTANAQIAAIQASNTTLCAQINHAWSQMGNQMFIEQRAIPYAIPQSTAIIQAIDASDFPSFVQQLPQYGLDDSAGENAPTLERICDVTVAGGQAIVALMREARNADRLSGAGTPPDNDVSPALDICAASATATLDSSGSILSVSMTNMASGYSLANPPTVTIYPFGYGGSLVPVIESDGSISTLLIESAGSGYPYITITIDSPPNCLPPTRGNTQPPANVAQPTFPGPGPFTTFSENPYLPGPVATPASASDTVDEARTSVEQCNCDCWNMTE